MSLVIVGSLAYDAVATPHGKIDRMLGGACTYISLSASFFTPVSIVGVVGDDFADEDVQLLESKGIDTEGMERVPGKTFFWSGVYSEDMNERTTLRTDLNVFAAFAPKLPASYRAQPYLFLGNIQPGLQRNVRSQMSGVRLVGAKLNRADLRRAILDPLMIAEGRFIRSDLSRSCLRHADFSGARARKARFLEADREFARLGEADLAGAEMEV